MAKKVERPAPQREEADDLDVLHPERTFTVGGESVTVREYGFVQGLRLRPLAAPFLEGLHQLTKAGAPLALEQVIDLIAEHEGVTLQLIAAAVDRDVKWLEQVNSREGELLLMSWWAVNGPFFIRSVQQRRVAELVTERIRRESENSGSDGATSTPPSSPTDTTQTESAATQSGN